ncbi:tail protein X [Ottowia sp.]|uniref:tail protein X n=1 Tax=Ottowia sp. TaxID=1898956 RepID=UPI003A843922
MTTTHRTVHAHQHDTLDAIAWRYLGRTAGVVEATLEANTGLAHVAADLPEGHPITLVAPPAAPRALIQLWD